MLRVQKCLRLSFSTAHPLLLLQDSFQTSLLFIRHKISIHFTVNGDIYRSISQCFHPGPFVPQINNITRWAKRIVLAKELNLLLSCFGLTALYWRIYVLQKVNQPAGMATLNYIWYRTAVESQAQFDRRSIGLLPFPLLVYLLYALYCTVYMRRESA